MFIGEEVGQENSSLLVRRSLKGDRPSLPLKVCFLFWDNTLTIEEYRWFDFGTLFRDYVPLEKQVE